MHAALLARSACVVSEIAGRAADALNPAMPLLASIFLNVEEVLKAATALSTMLRVTAVRATIGKFEQLVIVLFVALTFAVPIGTAEHVLDEAPGFMYECYGFSKFSGCMWVFQKPPFSPDGWR